MNAENPRIEASMERFAAQRQGKLRNEALGISAACAGLLAIVVPELANNMNALAIGGIAAFSGLGLISFITGLRHADQKRYLLKKADLIERGTHPVTKK
jgi:hypothetical protein